MQSENDRKFSMIVVIGSFLTIGIIFLIMGIRASLTRNLSDAEAIALLDNYRIQDEINLNQFLVDKGFTPTGELGAYVYRNGQNTVSIQDHGDYVRIGDGEGNAREFGFPTNSADGNVCQLIWLDDQGESNLVHLTLTDEALVEIVRTCQH